MFVEQKSMKLQPVYISIDNNYMIHNTPHIPVHPSQCGEIINQLAVGLVSVRRREIVGIRQLKSAKCPILDRL